MHYHTKDQERMFAVFSWTAWDLFREDPFAPKKKEKKQAKEVQRPAEEEPKKGIKDKKDLLGDDNDDLFAAKPKIRKEKKEELLGEDFMEAKKPKQQVKPKNAAPKKQESTEDTLFGDLKPTKPEDLFGSDLPKPTKIVDLFGTTEKKVP